jgi:hypothetical protein
VLRLALRTSLRKFFFIIFIDRIFTSLVERLFTNVLDMTGARSSICCV